MTRSHGVGEAASPGTGDAEPLQLTNKRATDTAQRADPMAEKYIWWRLHDELVPAAVDASLR